MALSPSSVSVRLFLPAALSPKALLGLCIALSMALCLSFLPVQLFPCLGPTETSRPALTQQQWHLQGPQMFYSRLRLKTGFTITADCRPNEGLTLFNCKSDL